jgi:integrase
VKTIENLRDRAVIGVYTLIPPRRVKDFALMKIGKGLDPGLDFNYLDLSDGSFQFNAFKTFKKYGIQSFKIPKELLKILKDYVRGYNLSDGAFLFPNRNGDAYTSFSGVVSKTFLKYYGKALSPNLLRHSFVTDFLNTPNISMGERRAVALAMGHSLGMQLMYFRLIPSKE